MKSYAHNKSDYPYRGVPLAPTIIVQLTKELFAGKLVTRQNIADQIPKEHLRRGGLPAKRSNIRSSIDEALRILQKAGAVENPSRGYWKVLPANTEITADQPQTTESLVAQVEPTTEPAESVADVVIGEGPASVIFIIYQLIEVRLKSVAKSAGLVRSDGQTKIHCREFYLKLQQLYRRNLSLQSHSGLSIRLH